MQSAAGALPAGRGSALLAGALGFLCFMPYVAVSIGRATAIQAGTFVCLLALTPILFSRRRNVSLWVFPVLLLPLLIGSIKAGVTGGDIELSMKTLPIWAIAFLTIPAIQIFTPEYSLELMVGIAIATILHAVVGAVQYVQFANGEFPFPWLYNNPSFLSVQDNAETLAKWTQRPFGIFPEPSAMSSSLAPWTIFWFAEAAGIVRLRRRPARWQRTLFVTAAVLALTLIILSRSGHTAITMVAVIVLVAIWFFRCRATPGTLAAIVGVFGFAMPVVLYFVVIQLGDRIGGHSDLGNSSWEDRTESLQIGFSLLVDRDWPTILFGVGPGLSSPILQRVHRLEAVWSVLLTYVYETGLVGAFAVCWVGQHLVRIWKSVRFDVTFAAIFVVWLVGVTVTTSYQQLLTIWMALGWLTVWPKICDPSAATQSDHALAVTGTTPVLQALMPKIARSTTHVSGWIAQGWREPAVAHVEDAAPDFRSAGMAQAMERAHDTNPHHASHLIYMRAARDDAEVDPVRRQRPGRWRGGDPGHASCHRPAPCRGWAVSVVSMIPPAAPSRMPNCGAMVSTSIA